MAVLKNKLSRPSEKHSAAAKLHLRPPIGSRLKKPLRKIPAAHVFSDGLMLQNTPFGVQCAPFHTLSTHRKPGHDPHRFEKNLFRQSTRLIRNRRPFIRDFYQRLLSKGKPYKVAVTVCMRKLLTILNARMRDYFAESGTTENGIQTV